jgi:hypothetical protein
MADDSNPPQPAEPSATEPPKPTIHEAELASGASRGVNCGAGIDLATAVARRQNGENVVVCGDDLKANRRLAERIEAAVGPYVRSAPHKQHAGPRALPHFQQQDAEHEGHTFYETPQQKAMRKKR